MISAEFTTATEWCGRHVARKLVDAPPRGRVVITGTVREVATVRVGRASSYRCLLDDGSGQIDLLFIGRSTIPGLCVGTRCTVEGTVIREANHLVVWNPLYRLEPDDNPSELPGGGLSSGSDGRT